MSKKKVLLIGWDAADWKVISPLMDRGKMPNLQHIVETGVMGNIATLHPVLSPMLWTSIATGKRPFKHGVYGFYEPTPDGLNIQPMTNLSRKCKAIWNILNQTGHKSNVVGWWPSHPAEPINGVMVSDLFSKSSNTKGKPKNPPSGSVHPEALMNEMDELRLGLEEIRLEDIVEFIPRAAEVDQTEYPHIASCGKTLAESATIQAVATHLLETTEWDFTAIYFDAIDHFCHGFMKYHPPRREMIDEQEFEWFQHVVTMAYVYHDMMLGRAMQFIDENTTIIVMSDHGFHPDHLRPDYVPFEPAGPALEHRELGIFAMKGPGIVQDKLIYGTTLLDVAPTILTIFGLPVAEDMDGRVITEAFKQEPDISFIPTWENVEGDDGQHSSDMQLDPLQAEEAIKQLVELGYVEELSGDKRKNVDNAVRELNFNLARAYMDANRYLDAVDILVDIYSKNQSEYRIGLQLAMCYKALGYNKQLLELADHLAARRVNDAQISRHKIAELQKIARARYDEKIAEGKLESDAKFEMQGNVSEVEKRNYMKHRSLANVRTYYFDFLKGYALSAEGKHTEALAFLERAIHAEPRRPTLHIQIGEVYLKLRRRDEARLAFEKALEIDEHNPHALTGMAKYELSMRNFEAAVDYALSSIGKSYLQPLAHYTLGIALLRLNLYPKAAAAFNVAISQNPNFVGAYRRLAYIYRNHVKDVGKALIFNDLAREAREVNRATLEKAGVLPSGNLTSEIKEDEHFEEPDSEKMLPTLRTKPNGQKIKYPRDMDHDQTITVVTGLPRSGTSLMMQMLKNGGADILVDEVRVPDEDNPKGYLELEKAKSLMTDNQWVEQAKGKVIKVVAPLLDNLPREFDYKIIFMYRDVEEVIQSQTTMLERNGRSGGDLSAEKLKGVLNYQLETAARMLNDKGIATIRVPYRTAVQQPKHVSEMVKKFLHLNLDVDKMVASVDATLYRNRNENVAPRSN